MVFLHYSAINSCSSWVNAASMALPLSGSLARPAAGERLSRFTRL
jgi:hypothetical protein